jgi:hypothetical protein
LVYLTAMGRCDRSTKLLEDTALASHVFGILVDRVGFVELTHAASVISVLESRFDLDLALHVVGCHMSCVAQAKTHAGGQ